MDLQIVIKLYYDINYAQLSLIMQHKSLVRDATTLVWSLV